MRQTSGSFDLVVTGGFTGSTQGIRKTGGGGLWIGGTSTFDGDFVNQNGLVGVGADNDYGHPAPQTVTAYRAAGALVGRTDVDGDLAVVVDGAGGLGLVRRGR